MSDDETTEDQQAEPDAGQGQAEQHDSGQENTEDDALAKVRREAAAYRRKLRDAEKERDALAEQIGTLRRGEVERIAGGQLADPSDLWRSGVELDQLLDDDGGLDTGKVQAAADKLIGEKPHYRAPSPDFDGGPRELPPQQPDFADSLRRAAGG